MTLNLPILSRVAASLIGGYSFAWGVFTFGITSLVAVGVAYEQAYTFWRLMVFVIFLIGFLWAYVAHNLYWLWLGLLGGGMALTGLAWAIQTQMLQGG